MFYYTVSKTNLFYYYMYILMTIYWPWQSTGFLSFLSAIGKFSTQQTLIFFLYRFPRKYPLTVHANCLLGRQSAGNVKAYFLGKLRKIFQNVDFFFFFPQACWVLTLKFQYFPWLVNCRHIIRIGYKSNTICHSLIFKINVGSWISWKQSINKLSELLFCCCFCCEFYVWQVLHNYKLCVLHK